MEHPEEKKIKLNLMEKQLRAAGQYLDSLWIKARSLTGIERQALHKLIAPLREKQKHDREEHETLKKS